MDDRCAQSGLWRRLSAAGAAQKVALQELPLVPGERLSGIADAARLLLPRRGETSREKSTGQRQTLDIDY